MPENVTIVLDTKAQTAGIQATVTGLKSVQGAISSVNDGFSKLTGWLSGFGITLSAGAFVKLSKDAIDAADNLNKAAQMAGISVKSFAGLAAAASLSDASIEDLISSSKNLSKWMEDNGKAGQSLLKVFLEQADAVSAMADGETKINYVRSVFGRNGQQLIPLLNQGSAAIRKQAEEARQFGAVIGPEFAQKAEDFNDNLTRMHGVVRGFFNEFGNEALNTLIPLQESLLQWAKGNAETIKEVAKGMADSVSAIASALGPLIKFSFNYSPIALGAQWLGKATANMHLPGFQSQTSAAQAAKTDLFDDKTQVDQAAKEQADLKIELLREKAALSDLETKITTAEQNKDPYDRAQKLNELYKQRVEILGNIKQSLSQQDIMLTDSGGPANEDALNKLREYDAILKEITVTEKKVFDNPDLDTFTDRMARNMRQLRDEFRNTGAAIADVFTRGIKGAIRGVADGIWDVIDGTRTWGEIFQQVGRRIISDLIEIAIQELFLDQLKRGLAMAWKAFTSFMRAEDVVESNASEAAKAPAFAANATLASIESWGIAVVVGLVAIGAILAATMGAFETGGVVRGGKQPIIVNEKGTESVLNARATAMLGEDTINRLNAGIIGGAGLEARMAGSFTVPSETRIGTGPATPTQTSNNQRMHLLLVDSRNQQAAKDFMSSAAGRAMVLDIVKNNKTEAGI